MTRCSTCDHSCHFVPGNGPRPTKVMAIGEKPGQEEDYRGKPFVGDSGLELDLTYLPRAGLDRSEIYVTNTVKCRLGGNNNKPTESQISTCASHHLPREIRSCRPSLILLLGSTACSLVPGIDLDLHHGTPVTGELFGYAGTLWPSYHPAAALHETRMMSRLLDDFARLGEWLAGHWHPPVDVMPKPVYVEIEDRRGLTVALETKYSYLPVDTENSLRRPWSLQFSPCAGRGYFISALRKDLLRVFWKTAPRPIFHNSIHDLDVIEAMGSRVPKEFRDTMQEAYHRGLPQGLKVLSWRLCGMKMQSWEDLVAPYSRRRMVRWLSKGWDWASRNRERVETQLKTKLKVEYKPTKTERDIKRILSHSSKPEYDIWEKAEEAGLSALPISPMPRMNIAHVPRKKAIYYACRDADALGRVMTELDGM